MKKNILIYLFIFLSIYSFSQKKELDHSVYDSWNNIQSVKISKDGQYTSYQLNPQKGDGELFIYDNEKQDQIRVFDRAAEEKYSASCNFIAFKVKPQEDTIRKLKIDKEDNENYPKDSLFVYSFLNDSLWKFDRVKSYQIASEDNDLICFLHEKEIEEEISKDSSTNEDSDSLKTNKKELDGTKLVLFKPHERIQVEYENVSDYNLSENGEYLIYKSEISDSIDSVYVYLVNTMTLEKYCVIQAQAYAKGFSMDKSGAFTAFYYSEDTIDDKNWQIKLFDSEKKEISEILSSDILDLPTDWKISENHKLTFTEDHTKLYFGTSFNIPKTENDSIPDDEIAELDIWSWNDGRIMPQQLKQLDDDKKKTFVAVYNLKESKAIQIADSIMDEVRIKTKNQHDLVLGYTQIPYLHKIQWSMDTFRDYFIVNTLTGQKKQIAEGFNGSVSLAPGGKYAAIFDKMDSTWYAYDVKNTISYPMTAELEVNFYNEDMELPMLPSHWGMAGWLHNDRAVIVYDKYDMWLITCGKSGTIKNLTNGFGRQNDIVLRYVRTDSDVEYIDENENILVKGFNKKTKEESLYFLDIESGELEPLITVSKKIDGITKADDTERYLYSLSDYNNYPDRYLVLDNNDWSNSQKISDANPQQKDYLWGSVEMYQWTDFNGETVDGLLYKPEGFNPNKKYPMIVYFYEKYSDHIHAHYTPHPSRSVISFPLFVSKGYVIFIPDIHYNTGQPGKDAYNSIVSGTYSLIEEGFIDKDKIGLQGQSWGGYQVAYLVTQTDLYACAMAGAPVSNMTSAYGGVRMESGQSRMMQYEQGQSRIGGTLWNELPAYIENSPVFFADQINTPLLIMHNDGDGAVPFSQGVELFLAMKRLGKPAWLLNYNGEEHNLKQRANCVDISNRETDFFDYYLMDKGNPEWLIDGVPALYKGQR